MKTESVLSDRAVLSEDLPPARANTGEPERERFETFVRENLGDVPVMDQGRYISPKIHKYWLTWQAAIGGRAATAPSQWLPIDTAPLGAMVMLWHSGWRHTFAGQRVGEHGAVVVDTCEPQARGADYFASHWMPLPSPPERASS